MPLPKTTVSDAPKFMRASYKVSMIVEYYKEMKVSAVSKEEAIALAEERVRARQKNLYAGGYSLGDIEILEAVER
jgi:hypothetical protein